MSVSRSIRRLAIAALLAPVLVLSAALPAAAAAGDLDPSFGYAGAVRTDLGAVFVQVNDLAVQSDQKIVVVGDAFVDGPGLEFAIARYDTSGVIDGSFGGGDGIVTTNFLASDSLTGVDCADEAFGVAVQPSDQKIVVAGVACSEFALARYDANGGLDGSFGGGDGKLVTGFTANPDGQAEGVVALGDGTIVAAGMSHQDFAVARYLSDGALDPSFSANGKLKTDLGGADFASDVVVDSRGMFVVAGTGGADEDFAVVRYKSDGRVDRRFDADGIVTTNLDPGASDFANAVAVDTHDRILVAGAAAGVFTLVRYKHNGGLDTRFDGDGVVSSQWDTTCGCEGAYGVAVAEDGKIVAAGCASCGGVSSDFTVVRFMGNGREDTTFGGGAGGVRTNLTSGGSASDAATGGVAIQADGKIVAAGCAPCFGQHTRFAVARYLAS